MQAKVNKFIDGLTAKSDVKAFTQTLPYSHTRDVIAMNLLEAVSDMARGYALNKTELKQHIAHIIANS